MNFLDLIYTIGFPSAPKLPPLPPAPEPLPDVNEADPERDERLKRLASNKKGRGSLITNEGGAAGLAGTTDETLKKKLGGE